MVARADWAVIDPQRLPGPVFCANVLNGLLSFVVTAVARFAFTLCLLFISWHGGYFRASQIHRTISAMTTTTLATCCHRGSGMCVRN